MSSEPDGTTSPQQVPLILLPSMKSAAPTRPAHPSSGHRSRKEKLVLRSFSTDIDASGDFSEPKLISSDTAFKNASKSASRSRRASSAPDHSNKSSVDDGDDIVVVSPPGEDNDGETSPEKSPRKDEGSTPVVKFKDEVDSVDVTKVGSLPEGSGDKAQPKDNPKVKPTKKSPVRRRLQWPSHQQKSSSGSSIKRPSTDLSGRRRSPPKPLKSILKNPLFKVNKFPPMKEKLVPPPVSQPATVPLSQPQPPRPWTLKRRLTRALHSILNSESDVPIKKERKEEVRRSGESGQNVPLPPGVEDVVDDGALSNVVYSLINHMSQVVEEGGKENSTILEVLKRIRTRCEQDEAGGPFLMGVVLEEGGSESFPRFTPEEIRAFETLVGASHKFNVGAEEAELADLFVSLMETEMRLVGLKKKRHKRDDVEDGKKVVVAQIIPVNSRWEESQNSHGLFIAINDFVDLITKKKREELSEERVLRSGIRHKRRPRIKEDSVINEPLEDELPSLLKDSEVKGRNDMLLLRSGKEVLRREIPTASLLAPSTFLNVPFAESIRGEKSSIMSAEVLNDDLLFTDPVDEKLLVDSGRCITTGRSPASRPLGHWSPPSSPSSSAASSTSSPSHGGVEIKFAGSPARIKRYSRHQHAQICPPFDNNNCSFGDHYCANPRAAGSRFCLQHVEQGSTLHFDRCKYVKGVRECGRFIPKTQAQTVFCDMHARAIAIARHRKMRKKQPKDMTQGILDHMKCNLDRLQGRVMEDDGNGKVRVREALWTDERGALNNSSDSDDDDEGRPTVADYAAAQGSEDSDFDEDIDMEEGEPDYNALKHAGYFSVKELAKMQKFKLQSLQRLYKRQLELLKRELYLGRREYLRHVFALRDRHLNFTTNPKYISIVDREDVNEAVLERETRIRQQTKDLLKNARVRGNRAVCQLRVMKARQKLLTGAAGADTLTINDEGVDELDVKFEGRGIGKPKYTVCGVLNRNGETCLRSPLPLARYCLEHITQDKHVRLFGVCGFPFGPDVDDVCRVTTLSEMEKFGCEMHRLPIPPKSAPLPPLDKDDRNEDEEASSMEELDKILRDVPSDDDDNDGEEGLQTHKNSTEDEDEDDDASKAIVREMEELVGDEIVGIEHFKAVVDYLQKKGVVASDTEESDDTDEEPPSSAQPGDHILTIQN